MSQTNRGRCHISGQHMRGVLWRLCAPGDTAELVLSVVLHCELPAALHQYHQGGRGAHIKTCFDH